MKPFSRSDSDRPLHDGKAGLIDAHRRSLVRTIFLVTGAVLAIFACFQLLHGNPFLAFAEVSASAVLFFGASRIDRTPRLQFWIYGYLIPAFCFFIFIVVVPGASAAAFVWMFITPIMSYLLLGRTAGFFLSAPFMVAVGIYYLVQPESTVDAGATIDLLNAVICGASILYFMHLYESMRDEDQSKLVALAETDALTGLANRSTFQTTLDRTINESDRSDTRFALVLMDIDYFKRVNDSLGHDAGDEVLRHIGRCLTERLRSSDSVGRLGGEEFGLILRDVDTASAYQLVDELRQRIAAGTMRYGRHEVGVTATFGIGHWPRDARKSNDLYQVADRRLYSGKHAGRNIISECDAPGHEAGGFSAGASP